MAMCKEQLITMMNRALGSEAPVLTDSEMQQVNGFILGNKMKGIITRGIGFGAGIGSDVAIGGSASSGAGVAAVTAGATSVTLPMLFAFFGIGVFVGGTTVAVVKYISRKNNNKDDDVVIEENRGLEITKILYEKMRALEKKLEELKQVNQKLKYSLKEKEKELSILYRAAYEYGFSPDHA